MRFRELGDHDWHEITPSQRQFALSRAQLALNQYDADSLELMTLNLQTELLLTQLDTDFDPESLDPRWLQRALFVTAVAGLQGQALLADICHER